MDASGVLSHFPELTPEQREQVTLLGPVYREWNKKINVVSRRDIDQLYEHHVLHSLSIAKVLRFENGADIMDVGTGGGFPGIPLAILFPDTRFTLVDSIGKKIRVVDEVVKETGLQNVTTCHGRAEKVEGVYDFIVSRAVTRLDTFLGWVRGKIRAQNRHLLRNGILYLKGGNYSDELRGIPYTRYPIHHFFDSKHFREKDVVHIPVNG